MMLLDLSKVELLLPMTGANNGTVFTDFSLRKREVTRFGDTKTVTAQSAFSAYGSSAYFDGTGDYLQLADDDAWHFGAGDFTIEFYIRPASVSVNQPIAGQRLAGGLNESWVVGVFPATDLYFSFSTNGTNGVLASFTHGMSANTWHHIAYSRNGANLRCFVDGAQVGSTYNIGTSSIFNSTTTLKVGSFNDSPTSFFTGHMQDLCITKGEAKYTANFTPPDRLTQRTISGTIYDRDGDPCKRKVYAVSRPTDTSAPAILAHGHSDTTTGEYELTVPYVEVTRVVVSEDDADPLLNDLVDRVIPE
jgi:hypothetical protein